MMAPRLRRPSRAVEAVGSFLDTLAKSDSPDVEIKWDELRDWGLATPHLSALRETVSSGLPLTRRGQSLFTLGWRSDDWSQNAQTIMVTLENDYGPLDEIVVIVGLGEGDRMAFNMNASPGLNIIGIDDGALRRSSCCSVLAHELSHCFFRSGCRFLDEGIAVLHQSRFPPPPAAFISEADRPKLILRQAPLRRSLAAMLLAPEGDILFSTVSDSEDSRQFTYVYAEQLMELLCTELSSAELRALFDSCGIGIHAIRAVEGVLKASLAEIECRLFAATVEICATDVIALAEQASNAFLSGTAAPVSNRNYNLLFDLAVRTHHADALRLACRWSAYRLVGALSRGGGSVRWLVQMARYLMSLTPKDNPDWYLLEGATHLAGLTQPLLPKTYGEPQSSPAARAEASYLQGLMCEATNPHLTRALTVLRHKQAHYSQ